MCRIFTCDSAVKTLVQQTSLLPSRLAMSRQHEMAIYSKQREAIMAYLNEDKTRTLVSDWSCVGVHVCVVKCEGGVREGL